MRTVVFGKKIYNEYNIDYKLEEIMREDGNVDRVFTGKPELIKNTKVDGWEEILSYDGEPRYNRVCNAWSVDYYLPRFNISQDEIITVEREIFRADLNEVHLRTDKVVLEENLFKEETEKYYTNTLKDFNKQMIESNDKMKAYCDLHKLNYEDTDCIELFKLVYPNNNWEIKDGKMQADKLTITGGSLCGGTICGKTIFDVDHLATIGYK